MGYYDSVKDDIKNSEGNKKSSGGSFDTLKESAERNTKPDEQKGDDTPIEVVEEGGIRKESSGQSSRNKKSSEGDKKQQERSSVGSEESSENSGNPFTESSQDDLVEKLDTIIDQNQRMIEILESFGN